MKISVLLIGILLSVLTYGQGPSMVIKVLDATTTFKQNVSQGTILIDLSAKQQYLVLQPVASTFSINTCSLLLLDNVTVQGTPPAQIKKIGANSSINYIGERIASVDGGAIDGTAIAVWTQDGIEKVLVAALEDSGASGTYGSVTPPAGWRLPNFWELNVMYNQSLIINAISTASQLLKGQAYWSSDPDPSDPTWHRTLDFQNGLASTDDDTMSHLFRFVKTH
jgi:hypothetical protein